MFRNSVFFATIIVVIINGEANCQWRPVTFPVASVAMIIADSARIIIKTHDDSLFVSSDEGVRWRTMNPPTGQTVSIFAMKILPDGSIAVSAQHDIWKTYDDGQTWKNAGIQLGSE